jgi:predicted metal-dependent phosphoesterase TrpH
MRRLGPVVVLLFVLVAAPARAEWLAGDLHVHTCHSHDVYCVGEPKEPSEVYTYGSGTNARFAEAAARGLDYLAITDHNDVRSTRDPGFGRYGVIGVPGYENSIRGHAQVLGERRLLDNGDGSPSAINALAEQVRADGGVFQANHPADGLTHAITNCDDLDGMHWSYRYAVQPDTIEVWNLSSWVIESERYFDCWLDRGAHIGLTGGSDSHWLTTSSLQGIGNPTTWVFARDRTTGGVLEALREGRTSVGRVPPNEGGAPVLLEAQRSDGTWRQAIGATVAPGTPMRVRSRLPGFATVRANRADLRTDAPIGFGKHVNFTAPDHGWVRATVHSIGGTAKQFPNCHHETEIPFPITGCPYDLTMLGMTSPAYIG